MPDSFSPVPAWLGRSRRGSGSCPGGGNLGTSNVSDVWWVLGSIFSTDSHFCYWNRYTNGLNDRFRNWNIDVSAKKGSDIFDTVALIAEDALVKNTGSSTSSAGRSLHVCLKPSPEKCHENEIVSTLKHPKGAKITSSSWGLDPPNPQTFLESKRTSTWNPPLKHTTYYLWKFYEILICFSTFLKRRCVMLKLLMPPLNQSVSKTFEVPRLWGRDLRSTLSFIIHTHVTHGQIAWNSKPDWAFHNSQILRQTSGLCENRKAATMKGPSHKCGCRVKRFHSQNERKLNLGTKSSASFLFWTSTQQLLAVKMENPCLTANVDSMVVFTWKVPPNATSVGL